MGLSETEVLGALGKTFPELEKEKTVNLWATALAIVFIEIKFPAQKEEWEMLTEKAQKWIKKQAAELKVQEYVLFDAVRNLVK
jgi:hypothetical protein